MDCILKNLALVELIKKEERYYKLQTEVTVNPFRKVHVLADKPMSRKPPDETPEDTAFLEAYRRARLEPNKKYPLPLTESQEIGWFSNELMEKNHQDPRFDFRRRKTDITDTQNLKLRSK
ncbi:PREDICTED: protein FAM183A [Cyprinodon variegatus]|uniref:protein FAM183A n=1 Tax=Cyprinodon variegatus TaxID=28743 RepID=UPI000742A5C5|nr:PREDICTED: protein FAM183A [Cyprinodon variegatus]